MVIRLNCEISVQAAINTIDEKVCDSKKKLNALRYQSEVWQKKLNGLENRYHVMKKKIKDTKAAEKIESEETTVSFIQIQL